MKEHSAQTITFNYDTVLLFRSFETGHLIGAITEKLRFREKDITGIEDRIIAKEARLKALWNARLGHQMEALPEFDEVFRTVRREIRQAGFPK
jgi:uncharacterized protein